MAGKLSAVLGRQLRTARRPAGRNESREKEASTHKGRKTTMKNAGTLKVTTPTDREIVMTRVFDAPRDLVFDAMSKPDLLQSWLSGPPGWSMVACENDLKVGGVFRHVWRSTDGMEMAMSGVYRE